LKKSSKALKPESRVMELLIHRGYAVGFVLRGEMIEHFLFDSFDYHFIERLGERDYIKEVRKVLIEGRGTEGLVERLGAEAAPELPHEKILLKALEEFESLLRGDSK